MISSSEMDSSSDDIARMALLVMPFFGYADGSGNAL